MHRKTTIAVSDGSTECDVFHPDGVGPWPAVLFYQDGIGMRDALRAMAARFASHGYYVLVPDMFYRARPYAPFDPASVFSDEPERARLMPILLAVTNERGMADTRALLDWLAQQPEVAGRAVGCVGYCLGGRLTLAAAGAFPERVAAGGVIHGGRMVTAAPDSPHLGAPRIRAKLYFAVPEVDPSFPPEERARLQADLGAAGVRYEMETFQAGHGFAVTDTPSYDRAASERHFERVLALFAETLHPQG